MEPTPAPTPAPTATPLTHESLLAWRNGFIDADELNDYNAYMQAVADGLTEVFHIDDPTRWALTPQGVNAIGVFNISPEPAPVLA